MTATLRCELTELEVSSCAHCRTVSSVVPRRRRTKPAPPTATTATTDTYTLVVDRPTSPHLIKAYRKAKLVAYAIQDAYGWAIVARRKGEERITTVDRFTPFYPGEPSADVRDAAIRRLAHIATWCGRP